MRMNAGFERQVDILSVFYFVFASKEEHECWLVLIELSETG